MHHKSRSWTLLVLALLQPVAGRLAQLTHRGASIEKRADAARGPVTPAKGAFAIWGPLFAGNLALAIRSFYRHRLEVRANRWVDWLSGAAFAGSSVWSLQAQFAGLGWPSFAIISGTAVAASAATIAAESPRPSGFARLATLTNGPLAGWLTVATFANLDSTLVQTQGSDLPSAEQNRAVALVGAASIAATGMTIATRGNLGYAGAAGWGLGGVLLRNRRESRPAVVRTAAIGLGMVGLATLLSRRYLRS